VRIKLSRGYVTLLGSYAPIESEEENSEIFCNRIQWNNNHIIVQLNNAPRSEAKVFAAWLLGSWVRMPLKAWMFVFVFLCCCPVEVEAFVTG
jgi:hypothetical protein